MGYNRYAYCNYNPLKYADPSGYILKKPEELSVSSDILRPINYNGGNDFYSSYIDMMLNGGNVNLWVFMKAYNEGLVNNTGSLGTTYEHTFYTGTYTQTGHVDQNGDIYCTVTRDTYTITYTWPGLPNAQSGGGEKGGNCVEKIKVGFEVGKISSEVAKEAGFIATIGTNGTYYAIWTTGNQYVKVFSIAKSGAYLFFFAGAAADVYMYSQGDISGGKLATNLGVYTAAIIIGDAPGIILGTLYFASEGERIQIQDNIMNNRPATFNVYNPELGW